MNSRNTKLDFGPQAILLDFYGTVVEEDDVPIARICCEIAQASCSTATPAEIGQYWSRQFSQLCYESIGASFKLQKELEHVSLGRVLKHFRADLDPDALSQVLYDYWVRPNIFPESRSVLAQCEVPVCLVSNIDNSDLRSALEHNDLAFDFVVTSEDSLAYKPRPEMFENALTVLHMSPKEVVCVGDSLRSDVRGAKAMRIPVLWINRKGRPVPTGGKAPDYVARNLSGLLALLSGEMNPC
jgi:2-haloacid dehalogenase/putative hydrolase of the HAD superfamily